MHAADYHLAFTFALEPFLKVIIGEGENLIDYVDQSDIVLCLSMQKTKGASRL